MFPVNHSENSPLLIESLREKDIRIHKLVQKWDRVFILDSI
jgi:hypothetical protein